ncbi:Serine threonine-protein kinase [Colletotrichum higginsianum IMI 349063]|uniref:Serine threonine-protein kinase n=1 Tax=Colletotrichum higginsianum (strain IMI 349063) TaxID=759273 RepID=A0A1B7YBT4_COLHI|nr:Serine threonine-protein kinase [Colletotrichum higginsianum IMI 349063]OBR09499.1 Serine threonine-protein kinase [Colletotrichum higginsianum IMI 349063]
MAFLGALESALAHLHNLGLAHNDLNPANILISETGMPVLIDFDSCRPIGQRLLHSRGTPGWTDESDSWDTSEIRHDTFAIEKIRGWLDEQLKVVGPTL